MSQKSSPALFDSYSLLFLKEMRIRAKNLIQFVLSQYQDSKLPVSRMRTTGVSNSRVTHVVCLLAPSQYSRSSNHQYYVFLSNVQI
jgi:hypothetical protein